MKFISKKKKRNGILFQKNFVDFCLNFFPELFFKFCLNLTFKFKEKEIGNKYKRKK